MRKIRFARPATLAFEGGTPTAALLSQRMIGAKKFTK
jgi:hypothetical protein